MATAYRPSERSPVRRPGPPPGTRGASDGTGQWLEPDEPDSQDADLDAASANAGGAESGPTPRAAADQQRRHRAEGSRARLGARLPGKQAATRAKRAPKSSGQSARGKGKASASKSPRGKARKSAASKDKTRGRAKPSR
jgi:hypothetical protein